MTPALRALFDAGRPTMPRAFAVLDDHIVGQIVADHPSRPTWGAARELTFGTLYLGGMLDAPLVHRLVGDLQQTGDVVIGCWPDDRLLALLPQIPTTTAGRCTLLIARAIVCQNILCE